jgi:hypothetical protein
MLAPPATRRGEAVIRTRTRTEDDPRVGAWALLPLGVAAAAIALAPWWLTGARLPLQNLWAETATAAQMPVVLLPFSQYTVVQVFAYLVVGSALAGIAGRALRVRGWGLTLLLAGILLVQVTATVQTALVVRDGLQDRLESTLYLAGLVVGTSLSVLVGMTVTILIARAPRAGALLGLAVAAIATGAWLGAVLSRGLGDDAFAAVMPLLPWIAPILTGAAIAWAGLNTVGRVLAALVSVALVWIAPALVTGIANALGTRVLLRSPGDLADYGLGVFRMALLTPELALRPVVATLVVAAIGLVIRAVLRRRAIPAG